jgi:hypothetical protein
MPLTQTPLLTSRGCLNPIAVLLLLATRLGGAARARGHTIIREPPLYDELAFQCPLIHPPTCRVSMQWLTRDESDGEQKPAFKRRKRRPRAAAAAPSAEGFATASAVAAAASASPLLWTGTWRMVIATAPAAQSAAAATSAIFAPWG